MPTPDNRRCSKAEAGGCAWRETAAMSKAMDSIRNPSADEPNDVLAVTFLEQLIRRAQTSGLGSNQYDAPIGASLPRRPMPWLGELKTKGRPRPSEGGRREYRVYFGEAPSDDHALLGAFFGFKTRKEMLTRHPSGKSIAHFKQTQQIIVAQSQVSRWCKANGAEYRQV